MAAARLNRSGLGKEAGISRFVALAHTEGCGSSGGGDGDPYVRSLVGYLRHPAAAHVLLLEHGCEKTHNDYFRHELKERGIDLGRYGWASIQLDGGIDAVLEKMERWFADQFTGAQPPASVTAGVADVRVALLNSGELSPEAATQMGRLAGGIVAGGGAVVVPENAGLLSSPAFLSATVGNGPHLPTLAYGQALTDAVDRVGFHVMETPTSHWAETLTGLGGTGVEAVLAYVGGHPVEGHPLVPVVQVSGEEAVEQRYAADMDLLLGDDPAGWAQEMADLLAATLGRTHKPKASQVGNIDFQFTRGLLGVSM